jgi:hypothetical protein
MEYGAELCMFLKHGIWKIGGAGCEEREEGSRWVSVGDVE